MTTGFNGMLTTSNKLNVIEVRGMIEKHFLHHFEKLGGSMWNVLVTTVGGDDLRQKNSRALRARLINDA